MEFHGSSTSEYDNLWSYLVSGLDYHFVFEVAFGEIYCARQSMLDS